MQRTPPTHTHTHFPTLKSIFKTLRLLFFSVLVNLYLWAERLPAAKARRPEGNAESISSVPQSKGHTSSWKQKSTRDETLSSPLCFCFESICLWLFASATSLSLICGFLTYFTSSFFFICLPASSSHISVTLFPSVQTVCRSGYDHSVSLFQSWD